ncbi:MAG TPA: LL-diaminopimelate aminotransferase [Bacillota bacterium]
MQAARRLDRIPPYLFAELERKREALRSRGVDVIDLGIGDPDLPTPPHVVEALARAAADPATHRYPSYNGARDFREGVARWFSGRFGVDLDPEAEVLALIGSKEGLAHMVWAFVDPGDAVLVPDPAYPVYGVHTLLAGGEPYPLPLRPENRFLPDLEAVPVNVARRARLLFLNYPNNPTGAVADLDFFQRAVDFARRHEIVICHDAAYTELTYDGYVAPSILEVPGAREVAVEFHSLSKPFNMTGWRIGFAVGSRQVLAALAQVKTNTDSGQFTAVQRAALAALLETPASWREALLDTYRRRRDLMVAALRDAGLPGVEAPLGSLYIWAPVPRGYDSGSFAEQVLEETGVVVAPGAAYGEAGEGYYRISLTAPDDRLAEAARRLRTLRLGGGA